MDQYLQNFLLGRTLSPRMDGSQNNGVTGATIVLTSGNFTAAGQKSLVFSPVARQPFNIAFNQLNGDLTPGAALGGHVYITRALDGITYLPLGLGYTDVTSDSIIETQLGVSYQIVCDALDASNTIHYVISQ